MKDKIATMQQLRNIGPVSARQLVAAGVDTPEKLARLGTEETFFWIFQKFGGHTCLNACYLYALEGAITGQHWAEIPEKRKQAFKQYTKELRESFQSS